MRWRTAAATIAGLVVGSCARYQPAPIDPALHVQEYRARRLDEAAMLAWVQKWAGPVALAGWTDRQLAVAAIRLRAEISRARAEWLVAKAGERTAGVRPAPGVNADVERAVSGSAGQPPWVVGIGVLASVELGGKRGARIQQARARTAAAEAGLATETWRVTSGVRRAAVGITLADAAMIGAAEELSVLLKVQELEQQRFAEAAVTSSELARTGSDVEEARVEVARAERDRIEARAALSVAIGLPPATLHSIAVAPTTSAACERLDSLGADSLQALALTLRPEMARVLAGYALAESDVRLQVARQYPDLDIGPGFIWDQGVHRWTLALALPALLASRHHEPIAEAEAARRAAGARVAEVQDSLLGQLAFARETCRATRLEQMAADSQMAAAHRAKSRADAAYARGESARLETSLALLAVVRAERARRNASRSTALASMALEDATGTWQGAGTGPWPDPRQGPEQEGDAR
jgi:outer membrane protein TolC